ncbi:MAG: alpha/beta hydrolase family protein, partial [Candidatus Dormibacteraceae bacterium]
MAAQPAPWRRRFLAPQMGVPRWARDEPGRCLYHSDESGRWECHAWDPRTGERRRLTDRPQGTGPGELDPAGDWLWWFDDESGDEFGVWMRQPFGAMPGAATPITLPAAYSAGLALASDRAVVGSTTAAGTAVHVVGHPLDHRLIYSHPEQADLGTLSRDERLLSIAHSEHGDSLHRALRVIDLDGERIADLWDGADRNLTPGPWSPVPGDQRMIVGHDRHDLERPGIWSPTTGEFRDLELPSLGGNVTARWFPDAASLLLVHRHRGRGELLRFHLEAGRLERLPAEPGTIRGAAVRPDGAVWMSWSTAARPPQIRSGGEPLIEPSGAPAPAGVPYQDLRVGSVHGFLAEPPGPRPHPAIFLIHGGPTSQDEDAFSPKAQAWVDHGYAVVHVDYRGSSGYGSAWRDALIGNPGFTELADIHAVRDRLVADGVADPDRLVLS